MTQFKTKGTCFALQFFYPPVQSKVLVMKTIIRQTVYYLSQRLDTTLFHSTINPLLCSTYVIRIFWLHLGLFECFRFVGLFIGKVDLTLDYNFFPFINLCLLSCFFNPVPKVINLTMVTRVIKRTHLTRVTYSPRSVVNQLLRQCWCEGNGSARFQLELFSFSWATDNDQKYDHCVVQNFLAIESPTGRT